MAFCAGVLLERAEAPRALESRLLRFEICLAGQSLVKRERMLSYLHACVGLHMVQVQTGVAGIVFFQSVVHLSLMCKSSILTWVRL